MHNQPLVIKEAIKLKNFKPGYTGKLDKETAKVETNELTLRIGELQELLYANSSHALLLIFQGMDASGKDGAVRRVLQHVNPAGVETSSFKVPSSEERAHDFLWRIHKAVPRYGDIGVFNRSHYEAILAERVLKIAPKKIWKRRYSQIVDFERMLVENRVVVLKFFLYISKKEQAERLTDRLVNPSKNWKFAESDLETRRLWDEYQKAYQDMVNETSHEAARWHLVPGDHNWYRDHVIASVTAKALEELALKWPKPKIDLSKIKIK